MFEALAQFLDGQTEAILERWRKEVRSDPAQPANRVGLTGPELDDHLPSLLRMLVSCLRQVSSEDLEKEGAAHGHQRRQHGYMVTELLGEMTLFRRVLMATVEYGFQSSGQRLAEPVLAQARLLLLDLLDRSVQASVAQFMQEAEAERDQARAHAADTTARLQQANAQLKEADLQKDRFLSVLSHELRNPLAPILSAVQVLKRLEVPGTERPHAIIERQAKHLTRLVDDLLDLNRIAYGKLELRPEVMTLQQAVAFATESSSDGFVEKGVRLVVEVPEQPIAIFADPTRLSQVVLNLLGNALKFTPAGGSVHISACAEGHEAVLRVRDTGAGIPPAMLARVFEPFEQADTSLAHSGGGLGLGLMIAKGLLEAQGGRIEVQSAGLNRGAEFIVRLPLSLEQTAPPPTRRAGEKLPSRRIAVIEDNEDAREALATALRLVGHEVFTGSCGEAALELARLKKPDVFILDIGLPGLDGYAVARVLRELPEGKHAKLIAVTGYGKDTDKSEAHAAGFDAHLTKPLDVDTLQELLR